MSFKIKGPPATPRPPAPAPGQRSGYSVSVKELQKNLNPEEYYKQRCKKLEAKLDEVLSKVLRPMFSYYDGCGWPPTLLECERVIDNWPE